ncbi:bifunctional nuclease domain-containing protein [Ktedonospora formicarum]|uniref:bifunctional nuclease domain-containing protein n=1 Tax=Ktedonospora formicarum TaxID=2778364 RepID=UPI001C68C4F6|nr:bifunctional nuclease domain-containing protein [Ktedonospora formicarum]
MKEYSDAQLVARARADDTYAFQLLIERYQAMAFYLAQHYIGETETARELVQDAFLQAYLSLDRLRDAARFKSWLYGIVLNTCRNWRRVHLDRTLSLDAQTMLFEDSYSDSLCLDPQEIVEERELQQLLRVAVGTLTPKNQVVAYLFYYEDMSVQEIARRLNIAQTTVKNRLHKGRQQLLAQLQMHYPEIVRLTTSRRKKKTMLSLKLVKVLSKKQRFSSDTTIILLDEQKQRIWMPRIFEYVQPRDQMLLPLDDAVIVDPSTTNFLVDMIRTLQGKVEEVVIDTLYEDLLYARVRLSGQRGRHTIKARLQDALPLALRDHCPIVVAEEILDLQAIELAEYGETLQQRLAAIEEIAEQNPHRLRLRSQSPSNFDFSDGLSGWRIFTTPQQADYRLDLQQTRRGKASLALTIHQDMTPQVVLLSYKSFSALPYRGKRLRAKAYLKADGMQQPIFNMSIAGSFTDIDMPEKYKQHTSYQANTSLLYIPDTGSWTAHEVVMDIPANADTISFSFSMRGQGKGNIWLDGIQLETVGKSMPLTGTLIDPLPRQPLNLNFANGLEFWRVESETPWQYERGVDLSPSSPAAYMKVISSASESPCTLQQILSTELYGGRCVRFSANVKIAFAEAHASLFMAQFLGAARSEESIKGASEWTSYELILAVPEGSFGLCFGITLYGTGQVWLKDLQLQLENETH